MRATTRTGSRSRRLIAALGTAGCGVLLTTLLAAPNSDAGASTPSVTAQQEGPRWVQAEPADFRHELTGADRADEQISEVQTLTIPFPGVWEVSYSARTYIGLGANPGTLLVHTALFDNDAAIPGSEALTSIHDSRHAGQDTMSRTFLHTFEAGDVVTLHSYRIGQGNAAVISNADGRTGVMAHWVDPL